MTLCFKVLNLVIILVVLRITLKQSFALFSPWANTELSMQGALSGSPDSFLSLFLLFNLSNPQVPTLEHMNPLWLGAQQKSPQKGGTYRVESTSLAF